ncbi:DUF6542 domain-containing protein [Streptomyces sp. NPDC091292]|uniref:DUF6542 domain-containing protein n=1 Tax=Streptomyces sp. NPDC091292 TaxID=3365991 RepID=UPI00382B53EF
MEQPRTRPPQYRPRRTAPLPPQAGPHGADAFNRDASTARRPASPLARRLRRLPNPRLTGLGSALFCIGSMFLLACLDQLLFGGSIGVYGVLFVLVSALTALWVRRADLVTAPVCVPIAFAVGILPIADGSAGLAGKLMGLFTALAMHAGWLYGGTLVAGVIVTVRKLRLMSRRRAAQRRSPRTNPRTNPRTAPRAPQPRRRPV